MDQEPSSGAATPPPMPPPPMSPAASPPVLPRVGGAGGGSGPRRSRFWVVAAAALAVALFLSLSLNLVQMVGGIGMGGGAVRHKATPLQEAVIEQNHSRNKIVVIDVGGIITGEPLDHHGSSMVDVLVDQLEEAGQDRAVKAVILRVDSPGGEVLAADDIARALRDFQKEYEKPVIASMGSLAASGGYYVSAPCRWIVAHELTMTGSIGVILHSYNYRGLLSKVGVRPEVYKSGKFKDMLSGEKTEEEILPEERRMMQAMIDETYARFKMVVAEGRKAAAAENGGEGRALSAGWEELADGRLLSGRQALEAGFVDELGSFDIAVERAKHLAGVEEANLVQYVLPFDLGSLFRLFGKSESRTVKLDLGVQVPPLRVGRLYFIAPTVLP